MNVKSLMAGGLAGAVLLGLAFLAPISASAAPAVCGPPPSDCLVVFNAAGVPIAFVAAPEAGENPNTFNIVPGIAPDPAQFGNATTLLEPGGTPANGPYSDIFGVSNAGPGGALVISFNSDNEVTTAFGGQGAIFLVETTEGPYDATRFLSPALRAAGDTAQFFSDVPEPASLTILAVSLLGMGAYRRLRK